MKPVNTKFYRSKSSLLSVVWVTASLLLSQGALSQTASSFDLDRYSYNGSSPFETFYPEEASSLQEALDNGLLAEETFMLVTETAAGKLALIRDQMAFHHIVQGSANGKNWMATF